MAKVGDLSIRVIFAIDIGPKKCALYTGNYGNYICPVSKGSQSRPKQQFRVLGTSLRTGELTLSPCLLYYKLDKKTDAAYLCVVKSSQTGLKTEMNTLDGYSTIYNYLYACNRFF